MSRWKNDDATPHAKYVRKWIETDKGQEYKERSKEYAKEWRKNNPEKRKAIQKRSIYKARLKVLQHYSGKEIPECRCCNETIFEFLEIDHIEGNGAEHRRSIGVAQGVLDSEGRKFQEEKTGIKITRGGNYFIYWLIRENFPKGFQILCSNCNKAKGTNKYCPHEIIKGFDLEGNKIEETRLEFPELTRRRRGEAEKEAEELGINKHTLRMRSWREKNPLPKKEKVISTHCKNGHAYADGNEYMWNGHKQCRQCKRDYKARKKLQQS